MKAAAVILGIMLAVSASDAQSMTATEGYFSDATNFGPTLIGQAEKGYVNCLQSSNDGVVASALAHVAVMRLALPTRGFSEVESQVAKLVKNASTPELRYKAYLTLVVMQHPEIFRNVGHQGFACCDELYSVLASRLCNYTSTR